MRVLGKLFAALAVAVTIGAGLALFAVARYEAPGPLDEPVVVDVPRGLGVQQIADRLAAEGVIERPYLFVLGVRLDRDPRPLKAGEYQFPAEVGIADAVKILRDGKVYQRRVTVPEGLTSAEIVALLEEVEHLTGEAEVPPEGTLLPDTYSFVRGESRQAVLDRMQAAMDAALAELWEQRAPELPLETPREAVILASIVEKETGVAAERAKVAGVFINRLSRGMRLQSDPTVIYGLTEGQGPLDRPLTRADWRHDSPFNTYRIDGLPPTPIANPGRAAIAAVLDPEEHDYLYFVADGSGGHAFAKTLREHNRNVAAWRRVRDQ